MSNTFTTQYLGLTISVDGQDPATTPGSPGWGAHLYNAFVALDNILGNTGTGVIVKTANITINADLSFAGYNATNLRTVRLQSLSAVPALGTDINILCDVNGDGYFIDGSQRTVRLTQNGALATSFFQFPERIVSGTITILPTDTTQLFYVDTSSSGATFNLPASSAVGAGRGYLFSDYKRNSETNNVTFVPNGTDTINTVNANWLLVSNGGTAIFTTDGLGHWTVNVLGHSYLRSSSIQPVTPLSGAGSAFTISGQNAASGGGGNLTVTSGAHATSGFDGYVFLGSAGNTVAFTTPALSGTLTNPSFGIGTTPGTDPVIIRGTGIPTVTAPNGSLFLRTDGGQTTPLYSRQAGGWNVIAAFSAPVNGTTRTVTSNYTIDTSGSDYFVLCDTTSASFTLTCPTPTAGRQLYIVDPKGTFGTNPLTLARSASEKINNVAASRTLSASGSTYFLTSDGTNWNLQ